MQILLALLQIFDIIIHAATNQLEPLRVTSNLVILIWLAAVAFRKIEISFRTTSLGAIGLYLLLNIAFLMREGFTNPEQGGELRIMLFVLVFLTTLFSTIFTFRQKNIRHLA
jgi:CDP-diglyceride synthetase